MNSGPKVPTKKQNKTTLKKRKIQKIQETPTVSSCSEDNSSSIGSSSIGCSTSSSIGCSTSSCSSSRSRRMPGLLNSNTGEALPLTSSEITSCVQGYAFGLMASLTYGNMEVQPFQGLFVYPLDEYTTVVGFEAIVSERTVTVQIKDKAKLNNGYFDLHRSQNGRITLDEDLERIVFVANLGVINPTENVSIFISTTSELQTLPSGAMRVLLPTVCVPPVPHSDSISTPQLQGNRKICAPKSSDQAKSLRLVQLLDNDVVNPTEYEFHFQLEIRGPCLLAGVESPTHEIRADASPSAHSAKSIIITLANKHTFDRPIEILIHPTEPHKPHILLEQGDMTQIQFDNYLKERSDFGKGSKKMMSFQRKMEVIRKRLHKDIPHHSVLMLNFCPDLQQTHYSLRKTHGEFIFLIDRSGSMSGVNMHLVKDAMILILKSLMPTCLFNIIGFGSTFKTLFPSSQVYSEDNLVSACKNIQHLRADMGGTNILSPLKWITRQPIHEGHPRLLFLLIDGSVNNTGKVIELLRNNASTTRCYSFGIGPKACPRLVQGLAAVSRGSAEFLRQGERLQPKMIKSLKKAMAPVLSDVTVEWIFPDTAEVLISPLNSISLFPGDRLVGYGIVCNSHSYQSKTIHPHSAPLSQKSRSSVFQPYQKEESAPKDSIQEALSYNAYQMSQDIPAFIRDANLVRGYQQAHSTNKIPELKSFFKTPTTSDASTTTEKHLLQKTPDQDHITTEPCLWQVDSQNSRCTSPEVQLLKTTWSTRKSSKRPGSGSSRRQSQGPEKDQDQGDTIPYLKSSSSSDSHSLADHVPAHHPLKQEAEPEMKPEPELISHSKGLATSQGKQKVNPSCSLASRFICKAVVKGMRNNKPVKWEVNFDLGVLAQEMQISDIKKEGKCDVDLWKRTFHHLAAKAIIRDFEQLAETEYETEPGLGHRYQVNAVHTSRACNVISKYTAFVPIDLKTRGYLPNMVDYNYTGMFSKSRSLRSSNLNQKQKGLTGNLKQAQHIFRQEAVMDSGFFSLYMDEAYSSYSPPPHARTEKNTLKDRSQNKSLFNSASNLKASDAINETSRTLNKSKFLTRAAKALVTKPPTSIRMQKPNPEAEGKDYLPLVSLQLASGAFLFNLAFCGATGIPIEKLKWTSPFTCHRVTLTSCSHNSAHNKDSVTPGTFHHIPFADYILSSSLTSLNHSPSRSLEAKKKQDLELFGPEQAGKVWATAVALGWLENNSASYFVEWELAAAKASSWLGEQEVPEGRNLAAVKTAAQQLFVLLRHWDENLEFNLLCYNPNSV
ncbi:von Willebrand factor A domain-containing protein 5B1 isoform X2 [Monodelphis domestica]|uniref:von Willebrand factor A domain-containing protein 5B1 isoform X2 n=1 Tax=Monodelphis domestica TaxID=13616 RepID=UPI0024E21AD9|nr:von Willebrand factor A domain-containing protein 5B1 isoform X2 [Monodelphis domestica]